MQYTDPATLSFLRNRRSHPPKMLSGPPPTRDELMALLELAARVPDHGKLEPWRFVVLERAALPVTATQVRPNGEPDLEVAVGTAPQVAFRHRLRAVQRALAG